MAVIPLNPWLSHSFALFLWECHLHFVPRFPHLLKSTSLFLCFPWIFGRMLSEKVERSPLQKTLNMDHAACTCAPREGAGTPLLEVCFPLLDHSRSMTTETLVLLLFGSVFLCTSVLTCSLGFTWNILCFHLHMLPAHHLDLSLPITSSEAFPDP